MRKLTVGLTEDVKIIKRKHHNVPAKFDTGAKSNSIDKELAKKIGLGPHLKKTKIKSSLSTGEERPVVDIKLDIRGKRYETTANIADRSHMKYKLLIGRDLIHGNFVIDVSKSHNGPRESDKKV